MVQGAIAEWRAAAASAEAEPDPHVRHQQMRLLRGVKATLEEQVRALSLPLQQAAHLRPCG